MSNNDKIGYVIVSHGYDYERLPYTITNTDFLSKNVCIVWSGVPGESYDDLKKRGSLYSYIKENLACEDARKLLECINFYVSCDGNFKCLKSRYHGFRCLMEKHPDLEYVQFIDSGDFITNEDGKMYDYDKLKNSKANLFWAPVIVSDRDFKEMLNDFRDYESNLYNETRNPTYFSCCWVNVMKEDADKVAEFGNVAMINQREDAYDLSVSSPRSGQERDIGSGAYRSNEKSFSVLPVPREVNKLGFSLRAPSIIAYPWSTDLVGETFRYLIERGISLDVNLAEDMLFHTAARCYLNETEGINCEILEACYLYPFYPDSLTHCDHDIENLMELNEVRGICAGLIKGNFNPHSEKARDTCENATPNEPYEIEIVNSDFELPEYHGVKLNPIAFNHMTVMSMRLACWNPHEEISIKEVVAYVPDVEFPVITKTGCYQFCAKLPDENDWKTHKWNISGNSSTNPISFNIIVDWNGCDLNELYATVRRQLSMKDNVGIDISHMIKLPIKENDYGVKSK